MAHFSVSLKSKQRIPERACAEFNEFANALAEQYGLDVGTEEVEPKVTVKVRQDTDPLNPRDNDVCDVMFCKHPRYNLGDKDAEEPIEEVEFKTIDSVEITRAQYENDDLPEGTNRTTIDDDWCAADWDVRHGLRADVAICIPIYLYDHSGITISHGRFSCPWDSGQVGWHYMTKDVLAKEFNGDEVAARKYMEAVLDEYDDYLRGNVWGYVIEDEDGDDIDSCWGFIGDELEECGMLDNVDSKYHELLKDAWERRFDR